MPGLKNQRFVQSWFLSYRKWGNKVWAISSGSRFVCSLFLSGFWVGSGVWPSPTVGLGVSDAPEQVQGHMWVRIWGESYTHIYMGICILENAAFVCFLHVPAVATAQPCGSGNCWRSAHFTFFPSTEGMEESLTSHPVQNEWLCFLFQGICTWKATKKKCPNHWKTT